MIEEIKNDELIATFSTTGAEMQSLKDARSKREYLWQGDPRYWGGRSPILFPIVGGMWNGACRIGDKEYSIPKHGFVRKAEWKVESNNGNSITFCREATAEELEIFPWKYVLKVTYELSGREVKAHLSVCNLSDSTMYFQIGGHPGFNLPGFHDTDVVNGYLQLEGNPQSVLRAGTQGCTESKRHAAPLRKDGLIAIARETFDNEALIFDNRQVTAATLLDLNKHPYARVESNAPVWLFWSPQGVRSPFVCCEPWFGLCDEQNFNGDISQRPYINKAEKGETWKGWYEIRLFPEQ